MCPVSMLGSHPSGPIVQAGEGWTVWLDPTRTSRPKPFDEVIKFRIAGSYAAPALDVEQTGFGIFDCEQHGDCKSLKNFWQGLLHVSDFVKLNIMQFG